MPAREEGGKKAVEKEHFARGGHERFVDGDGGISAPGVVEIKGRVTSESQLHDRVAEFLVEDFFSWKFVKKECSSVGITYTYLQVPEF